jgi:uncharacterized repeat protein (TIGR04138 family)
VADLEKIAPELFMGRPYAPEAYRFVLRALEFSVRRLPKRRHVSGQELLVGICDCARQTYGPLGSEVFRSWGVEKPLDFGRIVFDLVEWKLLSRREEDRVEDFDVDVDFEKAFEGEYNYLCDFHVIRNSHYPHAIPKNPPKDNPKSGGQSAAFEFMA